jgi:hypothetical protein
VKIEFTFRSVVEEKIACKKNVATIVRIVSLTERAQRAKVN